MDNGDGTTTRTIKAFEVPTSISFENKTALLSVEELNTSNVTTMSSMFSNCTSLTSLDLSNWDVSKVSSMDNLFTSNTALIYINCAGTYWSILVNKIVVYLPTRTSSKKGTLDIGHVFDANLGSFNSSYPQTLTTLSSKYWEMKYTTYNDGGGGSN